MSLYYLSGIADAPSFHFAKMYVVARTKHSVRDIILKVVSFIRPIELIKRAFNAYCHCSFVLGSLLRNWSICDEVSSSPELFLEYFRHRATQFM